jgi:hypothetical protein
MGILQIAGLLCAGGVYDQWICCIFALPKLATLH